MIVFVIITFPLFIICCFYFAFKVERNMKESIKEHSKQFFEKDKVIHVQGKIRKKNKKHLCSIQDVNNLEKKILDKINDLKYSMDNSWDNTGLPF